MSGHSLVADYGASSLITFKVVACDFQFHKSFI